MRDLAKIVIILLVCAGITWALTSANTFEPFRLERINSQDDSAAVIGKINRNSEKNERRDRQLQEFTNGLFPQWDSARTIDGWDTVYLETKYVSTHFYVGISPFGNGITAIAPLSDSSFRISMISIFGSPMDVKYYWYTIGEISSQ